MRPPVTTHAAPTSHFFRACVFQPASLHSLHPANLNLLHISSMRPTQADGWFTVLLNPGLPEWGKWSGRIQAMDASLKAYVYQVHMQSVQRDARFKTRSPAWCAPCPHGFPLHRPLYPLSRCPLFLLCLDPLFCMCCSVAIIAMMGSPEDRISKQGLLKCLPLEDMEHSSIAEAL
ncbi:hypothetical protein IWX90DRAFT_250018 [Phyllosticta citrichinensis]|uniref:Uncharacterized protein n=1 Tax=Phyllosticta citrichinensis TaxID=1130410 RepID=A0ABR1XR32_9PEZI